MKSYTYNLCKMMIEANRVVGLKDKLDCFMEVGRITKEEYTELCDMLAMIPNSI